MDAQDATVPINLATGQLNQQELITSALSIPSSTEKVIYREEVELKRNNTDMDTVAIDGQVPVSHPIITTIHEQMTSISTEQNITPIVHSTTHELVNTIATDTLVKCPQPSKLRKVHSYEEIQMTESSKREAIQEDEPKYDDILSVTEMKQQAVNVPGDPRYHILCDPNEPDEKEHNQQSTIKSRSVSGEAKIPLTRTAQRVEPFYEEVADTVSAEQTDQGRYNVLTTAMDNQDAVVQADTTENLNDEKYYSTTRVHRLVPVGKPIGRLTNNDNLYQILDSQKSHRDLKEYDQVQLRHMSACDLERSTDNISRSHSTTGRSLERLDPMYDEPFKPQRAKSLSKVVDIYDMDRLFDDPKYGTKRSAIQRSTDKLFDDPHYTTQTEAKERLVSFTVQYESLEGK